MVCSVLLRNQFILRQTLIEHVTINVAVAQLWALLKEENRGIYDQEPSNMKQLD